MGGRPWSARPSPARGRRTIATMFAWSRVASAAIDRANDPRHGVDTSSDGAGDLPPVRPAPPRCTVRRMYTTLLSQMKKTLGQLDTWLVIAGDHAKAQGDDGDAYLELRLAPDQFPLARQVQIACDTAKFAAARLAGVEAPNHPDTEKTLAELRTRVAAVIAYLDGFKPEQLAQAATRKITQPRWEGKWMTGADYFVEHALPNFFFHAAHTYAILRHRGVKLGKRDYLGPLSMRDA